MGMNLLLEENQFLRSQLKEMNERIVFLEGKSSSYDRTNKWVEQEEKQREYERMLRRRREEAEEAEEAEAQKRCQERKKREEAEQVRRLVSQEHALARRGLLPKDYPL